MMRQLDSELNRGDCPLFRVTFITNPDRITQVLDPHAVDRNLPVVWQILGVGKLCGGHELERLKAKSQKLKKEAT